MPPYAMWLLKEVKKETITRSCAVMIDLLAEKTVGYFFLYYLNWPMRGSFSKGSIEQFSIECRK